jgi:hypothetical protein
VKLDAEIMWLRDYPALGAKAGDTGVVPVDKDYVEADCDEVEQWVESELERKAGGRCCAGDDFEVTNLADVVSDLQAASA